MAKRIVQIKSLEGVYCREKGETRDLCWAWWPAYSPSSEEDEAGESCRGHSVHGETTSKGSSLTKHASGSQVSHQKCDPFLTHKPFIPLCKCDLFPFEGQTSRTDTAPGATVNVFLILNLSSYRL